MIKKNNNQPNKTNKTNLLINFLNDDDSIYEIGVDEVGRGPMFGRVYTAAVILPRDKDFDFTLLKDSKKFTSKKKLNMVYEYIIKNCVAYSVSYIEHNVIDKINIRNATHDSMHISVSRILDSISKTTKINNQDYYILVDGNYFKPYTYLNTEKQIIEQIKHSTIEHGDNTYSVIAAASIIAKVERDKYIEDMCSQFPKLNLFYDIGSNKGYGTQKHMDGIKKYGISPWHRTSFGICRSQSVNNKDIYL